MEPSLQATHPSRHLRAYSVGDLQSRARRILPRGVYDFVKRGSENEVTCRANRAAFERLAFLPRVGRDVSDVQAATMIFGRVTSMPLAIAPTGGAGILSYRGDLSLARAAARAGIPFGVSSASTVDIEDIAATGARLWFQLYLWENRELSALVVDRAERAGCEALIMTLDIPVSPNREHSLRAGFQMPFRPSARNMFDVIQHPHWLFKTYLRYVLNGGLPRQANLPLDLAARVTAAPPVGARFRQDDMTWDDIARMRDRWPGKFILKGILAAEDAVMAAEIGADAIIVSNHGGRSVDGAPASIDMLPALSQAVSGRTALFLDSGVRRGSDIVKAIALGATAVLAGRAPLWGLAAAGEAGVDRALELLREELLRVMAMCGRRTIGEIDRSLILDPFA